MFSLRRQGAPGGNESPLISADVVKIHRKLEKTLLLFQLLSEKNVTL